MATLAPAKAGLPATRILDCIRNTSLVRLEQPTAGLFGVQVLAKAEWHNPGGSVKGRATAAIMLEALRGEKLCPGQRLLDATSGKTGIAYAMLGASLGFGVTLRMPSNVSPERKRILRAYGAEVVWTDPAESSDGAIRRALAQDPGSAAQYFYADQSGNPANWRAHYNGTGPEIVEQIGGRVTPFVAGLGTSGTFMGVARRLKEVNPGIERISIVTHCGRAGQAGKKAVIVTILPDGADKYPNERFRRE